MSSPASPPPSRSPEGIADDLDLLLAVMPPDLRLRLGEEGERAELLEVVLDLGRPPEARFPARCVELAERAVSADDLRYVVERVGRFGADNRAGIERTLHRISALRNRVGDVVGLTCRVGRSLFGTVDIVRDVIESGQSLLLLGPPGVGKTTLLRESARVLAGELGRRVVIVDTSNEIAGDGDIPHPGIGRARRMQVPTPEEQHRVMIEAVENHMPQVIVIDEIGTGAEALAARTIAERGVQLVATAHGNRLENLLRNPTLSDLVGGIHPVTLSDEEARRRGTQKTVLERKAEPTFGVVVEIQDRDTLAIHHGVGDVIDHFLRGFPLAPEVRERSDDGYEVREEGARYDLAAQPVAPETPWRPREHDPRSGYGGRSGGRGRSGRGRLAGERTPRRRVGGERRPGPVESRGERVADRPAAVAPPIFASAVASAENDAAGGALPRLTATGEAGSGRRLLRVFPYAVSRAKLERAIRDLRVPAKLVEQLGEADIVLTTKAQERRQPRRLRDAELRGTRLEVVKSNSVGQLERFLADAFGVDLERVAEEATSSSAPALALREAEQAIDRVLDEGRPVELAAQDRYLRRLQHELVIDAGLASQSKGDEPYRRVVVYPA